MVRVAFTVLCAAFFSLLSLQVRAQATPATVTAAVAQERTPGPADLLQLALDKHLYFAAELALQHAPNLPPEQAQYFQGMLAFHEGRFEDARRDLIAALNAKPTVLISSQKIAAFETLGETARLTNLYGACAQMYDDIEKIWGAKLGSVEQGILESRHFCAAQQHTPVQTIDLPGAFTIQRQGGAYPIRIGNREGLAAIDLAAAESVITESTAKAWGVIPSDATVTLHGYSGGAFQGHPAVIPELTIGKATLHDVAVLVTPDANFDIAPANVRIPALLGFPVAYALGRLTFARDGSLTVLPSSPPGAAEDGARLWLGDRSLVLAELQTAPVTGNSFRMTGGVEPRLFVLDTGSRDSYFTDHYYNEHRETFPGAPPETAKLAGAGGIVNIPAYGSDHIPLRCDPWVFLMTGPHVLTEPMGWEVENYEGLLGQDVLGGFRSYTIDLRAMRFHIEL